MASISQTDHHMNGISRLQASMHPAAFSNALASDYRERYMVDGSSSPYHHGRSNFNRNGSTTTSSGGYQHNAPLESSHSVWQQRQTTGSDIIISHHHHHGHSADTGMRGGGGSSRVNAMLGSPESMNRGSPASLQSSSSELYDSSGGTTTTTVGGDWQQFVDSGVRYSSLLPPASSCGSPLHQHSGSSTGGGGNNEGAMIRELIGRLGGASMGSSCNGGSLTSTSTLPSQHAGGVVEKLTVLKHGGGNHTSWNVNSASAAAAAVEMAGNVGGGLTVDPSKGGLSLNGLTTSHCLSPFSGDPGFAERAARFSSFSNGNYAAQPFSSTTTECGGSAGSRMRSRSSSGAAAPLSESSTKQQRESVGVLNSTDLREAHSVRGVSEDLLASASPDHDEDDDDEDDNSGEGNYGLVKGKPAMKLLSRTASNLLASAKCVDEQEEGEDEAGGGTTTTTTISADASSNPGGRIQGISTSSLEQTGAPAGPREGCQSPAVSSGATDISAKKRKTSVLEERRTPNSASSHGERDGKITEVEDTKAKRFRRGDGGSKDKEEMKSKAERSSSETSGETSPRSMKAHSKPSEPPSKPDYIHVRARRGQATDSHSLAERVRREKISERMKFLQDLVPGCSKVTGKAVMLDEIINYVQSLQRQVEFLSMKLASVNPRLDFNLESFLGKEGPHPGSQAMVLGSENCNPFPPMHPHLLQQAQLQQGLDYQQLHSEATLRRSLSVPVPAVIPRVDGFVDGVCQTGWDDGELQSIVQMGIGHTPSMSSPSLHCHLPPGQVKVELQQSPISCL